jgi:AcrR family transcriptional regulator
MQAEKSGATVAGIRAAAERLFLEADYADVSMDRIAERARVTKGALYHHFASKEELYVVMMEAHLAALRRVFEEAAAGARGCRERLRSLTAAYFALPREKRDLLHLVRRDANSVAEPARSRLVRLYQAALPQPVERILADGMRDGEIRRADPRLLSWHFVAIVEVTLNRYAERVFANDRARVEYSLDLFFKGCRP